MIKNVSKKYLFVLIYFFIGIILVTFGFTIKCKLNTTNYDIPTYVIPVLYTQNDLQRINILSIIMGFIILLISSYQLFGIIKFKN